MRWGGWSMVRGERGVVVGKWGGMRGEGMVKGEWARCWAGCGEEWGECMHGERWGVRWGLMPWEGWVHVERWGLIRDGEEINISFQSKWIHPHRILGLVEVRTNISAQGSPPLSRGCCCYTVVCIPGWVFISSHFQNIQIYTALDEMDYGLGYEQQDPVTSVALRTDFGRLQRVCNYSF